MIGRSLAHYEIRESLGAGGMGEVYLATDTRLGRDVALKVLPVEMATDPSRQKRFRHEAKALAALNHPNIVTIYSIDEDDGIHFLTMEVVRGQSLADALPEEGVGENRFFPIALQLADALAAAHEVGVVHRDLKPSNVMIGEGDRVKILDFGLATVTSSEPAEGEGESLPATRIDLTGEGKVVGTVPYMSPEQIESRPVDARSDIFSLGIILYELATGERPFHGDSHPAVMSSILKDSPLPVTHLNPSVLGETGRVIARCLEKDPGRRYPSATALRDDLQLLDRERVLAEARPVTPAAAPPAEVAPRAGALHFSQDLFISYAQLDNEAQLAGQEGWVSAFHRSLEVRVGQLLGKKPSILRALKSGGDDAIGESEIARIPESALLITVLSPRYVKSEWCNRELQAFLDAAAKTGGPKWGSRFRVFKVVKTPTPENLHPPQIQPLLGYEFYKVDPDTGRPRELDQIFGPEAQRDYWARLDDLAHDIVDLLARVDESGEADVSTPLSSTTTSGLKGCIYLASTSHDLKEEHDAIRRDMQRHGYRILPDEPLPLVGDELESFVHEQLDRSVLSIHLVGSNYGMVPEGSTESTVEIQIAVAAQAAARSDLRQLIWIPRGREVQDERQRRVIDRLHTNPHLQRGSDFLETHLEDLKTVIHQTLNPPRKAPVSEEPENDARHVYLICDQRDQEATSSIADYLFDSGLEVTLPVFEGDEAEVREDHEDNLRMCDGVLVYYGNGNELWLRRKLREVQKSAGLGRVKSMAAKGIWVAPPLTPQKSRLRLRDTMVMAGSAGEDLAPLRRFVDALTGNGGTS